MTKFVPNKEHSRTALIFCFHLKKTTAESYRLLGEAYDEHAPSCTRCTSMKWRFEKQMAHQCSVKYKDLTLYTILLYHQQVSNAQSDLIEKCSHSIVLLCSIWQNLYQIRSIADSINFLFSFEENCCGIIPITWRSLWWIGSIAKNVWTMISAFQKWGFRCCRQGTRKTAQKVRRRGIASIAGWRWFTNTKTTRRAIER